MQCSSDLAGEVPLYGFLKMAGFDGLMAYKDHQYKQIISQVRRKDS